jgi:SAM-dependent methyltransferase
METQDSGDYRESVAEFYDESYNRRGSRDVEFYVSYSQKANGRTLELGCGTGRVLIPTAVSGCQITGLDLSPSMLKICREKLANQPIEVQKRIELIQGDMTSFDNENPFSLITIPFRPFQHLITVEAQKACLDCVIKNLAPGGLFVFDVYNPFLPRLIPNTQYISEAVDLPEKELPDGRKLSRSSRIAGFHQDKQYNDIELIYYISHPDGRTERLVQAFPMRYFFRYEMEHLLENSGFKIIEMFGNFDRSPFSVGSPEMIFVARKK